MIGIVDYGLGNVGSFETIFRRLGLPAKRARTPDDLATSERLILPGVGAFDWAMGKLNRSGMRAMLDRRVLEDKVPVLGVCVGMQIMAEQSDEGNSAGLGWIKGHVERFRSSWFQHKTHLPHMGWNTVSPKAAEPTFKGIDDPQYYFLHSYFFKPADPDHIIAHAHYGIEFAAAVRSKNIVATQFHPEKSHDWGIGLLKNFAMSA